MGGKLSAREARIIINIHTKRGKRMGKTSLRIKINYNMDLLYIGCRHKRQPKYLRIVFCFTLK